MAKSKVCKLLTRRDSSASGGTQIHPLLGTFTAERKMILDEKYIEYMNNRRYGTRIEALLNFLKNEIGALAGLHIYKLNGAVEEVFIDTDGTVKFKPC